MSNRSNGAPLFASNYWGHNAIIRLRPFIQYCDLPELPEPDTVRRHILSHDTVEAAEEAGMALKNQFQMLQVQVYDAATRTRSMIEWPAPA